MRFSPGGNHMQRSPPEEEIPSGNSPSFVFREAERGKPAHISGYYYTYISLLYLLIVETLHKTEHRWLEFRPPRKKIGPEFVIVPPSPCFLPGDGRGGDGARRGGSSFGFHAKKGRIPQIFIVGPGDCRPRDRSEGNDGEKTSTAFSFSSLSRARASRQVSICMNNKSAENAVPALTLYCFCYLELFISLCAAGAGRSP